MKYVLYHGAGGTCIEPLADGQSENDLLDSLAFYYEDRNAQGFLIIVTEDGVSAEPIEREVRPEWHDKELPFSEQGEYDEWPLP